MRTIEITIAPDGNTQVETKGFTGPACREASKFLEEALGKSTHEKLTGAFYETCSTLRSQQQRT